MRIRSVLLICTIAAALGGGAPAAGAAGGLYGVQGPWLDDRASAYRLESLQGGYTVLTLAYGACRRVCSSSPDGALLRAIVAFDDDPANLLP
jgi:cytochrome oxidase Cu insertion factor (SCO1/SenC/PrrC family)